MFKNRTLGFKVTIAFLAIAALLAAASFYQIRSIQHFDKLFTNMVDVDLRRLSKLEDIALLSMAIRDEAFEYQHEIFKGSTDTTPRTTNLKNLAAELQATEDTYRSLVALDNDQRVSAQHIAAIRAARQQFIKRTEAVIQATKPGNNHVSPESQEQEAALISASQQLNQTIGDALAAERQGAQTEEAAMGTTISNLTSSVAVLAFLIIALAIGMGAGIATWISRSLSRLKAGVLRIATGDFSHSIAVTTHDEIGQLGTSFNTMAERLKESYRRLAIEQQRAEAMLQSMGEGLIALDDKGHTVLINQVALDMISLTDQSDAIGKDINSLLTLYNQNSKTDTPIAKTRRPGHHTLATGKPTDETFATHRGDKKYLLDISANPIKLEGKVIGAILILRDVTKEREVDRMKTEFISLASHQLRTPLSAIKWFCEMLLSGDAGKLATEQKEFIRNISEATERMIALVGALLNISRIESGRIMVDPQPTDLKELVAGIVNDLKGKTEEKHQTLIISVHSSLPKINLDPRLIGQVYLNLLTNAIRYTPEGGEISVFVSRKGDRFISQVTDNGYGIPKDQQERIFQKFFRAANAVKVETDGTGLGLYLIKAIVESSGGKIWFKSDEGKGTTFWFSMPMSGMKHEEGEVTLDV